MALLTFIDDDSLKAAVTQLLKKAKEAKRTAKNEFGKNVIDPFSALFQISGFRITYNVWFRNETTRQAEKSLQNHVGEFHQTILGKVMGWEDKKTGGVIDLVSKKQKIIAEVKNKHNTISGGKLVDLYNSLDDLVMPKTSVYKGYTAYYVAIIPKKSVRYNKEFTPSDKQKGAKCPANEQIREIDGGSFYDLVTGKEDSLKRLFEVLPDVIESCIKKKIPDAHRKSLMEYFTKAFG